MLVILIREVIWGLSNVYAENVRPCGFVWEWDVDALVKATSYRLIERVRRVGRRKH